ncbi:hypothetical protein ATO1_24000 [Phaeobacter sp. 22II1-1F12B]|nr:hypothetical protein ATO1_24000 [Phaeobacter sp. 22II1-1F12B]
MFSEGSEISAGAPKGSFNKNVLLIAVDDLFDYKRFASFFGLDLQMPNLERLAAQGITFSANSTTSPQCNPARTAMLTGESAFTTGVYQNKSLFATDVASNNEYLPLHFSDTGYTTGLAGKVFHGIFGQVADDFDTAVAITDDAKHRPVTSEDHPDYKIAEFARTFLSEASSDQPFFLSIGFHKPHKPWVVPEE